MSKPVQVKVGNLNIDHMDFSCPILLPEKADGGGNLKKAFESDQNLREYLTSTREGVGLMRHVVAEVKHKTYGEVTLTVDQVMVLLKDQKKHHEEVAKTMPNYVEMKWDELKTMPSPMEWMMGAAGRLVDEFSAKTNQTTVYGPGSPRPYEKPTTSVSEERKQDHRKDADLAGLRPKT